MKVNTLETHDRLLELQKQAYNISQGCQDCIDKRPKEFENYPFYIFAHKREISLDEKVGLMRDHPNLFPTIYEVPTHRMIWIPRLKKPKAQINSMLFRYYPSQDLIKIIWIIPDIETWEESRKGQMCENDIVSESVYLFNTARGKLEAEEDDEPSEERAQQIYRQIGKKGNSVELPGS